MALKVLDLFSHKRMFFGFCSKVYVDHEHGSVDDRRQHCNYCNERTAAETLRWLLGNQPVSRHSFLDYQRLKHEHDVLHCHDINWVS